ncbi:MAG: helix-turn-helix transcriptional regulator [Phenylobacterium sp.]|nr:helix-turn-helix transcriptional regulator [Phenylobacterium sp.]
MDIRAESIVEALRNARRQKGWSQRALSQKAGLTQAHLSRIESGAIDLKLSTLLELARLLDLEPILAPRTALLAVHTLIHEANTNRDARTVRGAANSLQQLARHFRVEYPKEPLVERLAELTLSLHSLEQLYRTPLELAELLDITEALQTAVRHPDLGLTSLRRGVERLARLRNQLVHPQPDAHRPAYSLDDED